MHKIFSAILTIVLLISLCCCTYTESDSFENKEISISEFTTVDGFECQIKEVNWYSPSDFDFDVIQREDGFEYLVIVLSEKNTTDDTQNAPMTNALSADGKQCINLTALSQTLPLVLIGRESKKQLKMKQNLVRAEDLHQVCPKFQTDSNSLYSTDLQNSPMTEKWR